MVYSTDRSKAVVLVLVLLFVALWLYPPQTLFVGGILFSRPSVRVSVRPSVRPSVCPSKALVFS